MLICIICVRFLFNPSHCMDAATISTMVRDLLYSLMHYPPRICTRKIMKKTMETPEVYGKGYGVLIFSHKPTQ